MPILKKTSNPNLKLFIATRKKFLLAIILLWAGLALAYFGIRPQVVKLLDLNKQLGSIKGKLTQLKRKSSDLTQIETSEQFKNKEKVDEVLPSHKPILELLTNLHQAAFSSKVGMQDFSLEPGEIASASAGTTAAFNSELDTSKSNQPISSSKKYDSFEFELTVTGTEENVQKFIDLVEQIVPFTTITDLKISRLRVGRRGGDEENDDRPQISRASMTLQTYYYTQSITATLTSKLPSIADEEIKAFEKIQQFRPSGFEPQSEIIGADDLEDLFEVEGLEQFEQI